MQLRYVIALTALAFAVPTVRAGQRSMSPTHQRTVPAATTERKPTNRQVLLPSRGALPGIVQPGRQVELLAQTDGVLAHVPAREGQRIKKGEVLCEFDKTMARAAVRVAEAATGDGDVRLANVDLKLAHAELRRLESVPDQRALAAVEVDRARAAVERAQAQLQQAKQMQVRAKTSLMLEQERMRQLSIRAPFDGVVIRIASQEGASMIRSAPLLTVADLSTLRTEMFVDLKHFNTLRVGERYLLHAAAPVNRTVSAKLMSREPIVNAATKTFRCVFEIPNTAGHLPAGFTVHFNGERARSSVARARPGKSGQTR